jgi:hypothetical protein
MVMTKANGSAGMADRMGGHGPSSGGYYWFPTREAAGVTWKVLTCHDLGYGAETGHDNLWPSLVDRLADAWGKDRQVLARHLGDHYTGLPRGRITGPGGRFLVWHGNDAPVGNWKTRVRRAFGLESVPLKAVFDEHETTLDEDRWAVEAVLEIEIGGVASRPNGRGNRSAAGARVREQDR